MLYPIELLAHAPHYCICEVVGSGGAAVDSGGTGLDSDRAGLGMFALSRGLKVADNHGLGPVDTIPSADTVPGTAAEECAVAALARLNKVDMRIGEDPLAGLWSETDKRIVLGEEHKRGHGNAVDDTSAGSAVVVVVCIAEAAIGSDDFLVEFADGADGADAAGLIDGGKELSFVAEALHQCMQKMTFIDEVGGRVQSIGAGGEIDDRTDRGHCNERWTRAPLAGQFEHHVAAHGVANQRHALEAETLGEVANHRAHICGAAGVKERRRKRIGAAAVAHVHADDVHSRVPGSLRDALNVARVGGTIQPMHEHGREPRGPHRFRLPMAVAEDAASIRWVDFHGFLHIG